jgi:proteasome assembly chaperone (PAC2) family protein
VVGDTGRLPTSKGPSAIIDIAAPPGGSLLAMNDLRWESRPKLRAPMMIAAFEGWTDAGGAASGAASYLSGRWQASKFADIDAEDFYDFTALRPQVRLRGDQSREIVWPVNRFLAASIPGPHDLIIMIGVEPHMRWRTFSECVTTVATELEVEAVFTLGAMLADVAHTRPVPVRTSTADPRLAERMGLRRPQYQGPTGIVGVLQDAFAQVSIPVGSLMAQVPHYIPGMPSPKATLAVVQRVCELLATQVPTSDLEKAAATYERQVDEVVAGEDEIAGYVRELERRTDQAQDVPQLDDLPSGDTLAAQLEQFLRDQGNNS